MISRAGLVFSWLSVSICQWIPVLTVTTALEEAAPPALVAACWWEGRGQGCECEMSPGEAGSHADMKHSQVQMAAAKTLPRQDKQYNIAAFHHEE